MTSERMSNWVDGIAHGLIRCAARRAPDSLTQRLEEEWLADMMQRHGQLSRLRFAVGCCWATNVIAREHGVAAVPAAGSSGGQGYFMGDTHESSPLFSRRTVTFLLVACLHAAVLYGLMIGLTDRFKQVITVPFVSHMVDAIPPKVLPPRPQLTTTRIVLDRMPELPPIEPDPQDAVQSTLHDPPRVDSGPSNPAPAVDRVQGGPGVGFPSADDFYPSVAIRREEQGVATVRACVDDKGRLISDPTIVQSTGSPRLDEGALKLAKAGSGHYRATTEDGRPVNSCYPFRIRFDLKN